MDPNKIYDFAFKFFKGLGCEVSKIGNYLHVKNIPFRFEKYSGKKGPYKLIFQGIPERNQELLDSNSYLLKAMGTYLEDRGRTTLLKINFNVDAKEKISKLFKLRNCEIEKIINT